MVSAIHTVIKYTVSFLDQKRCFYPGELSTTSYALKTGIRAVAGQHSSPELSFANETKMFFRVKNDRRKITGP